MNVTSTERLVEKGQATATSSLNGETALTWEEIQAALHRMSVRVNASHAHGNSLGRAAEGIKTINGQLSSILNARVARLGDTAETNLASSTIQAMRQQVDAALSSNPDMPVEVRREYLQHALSFGHQMLALLRH